MAPSSCVAIEDSRWGIESAKAAGFKCVGITTTYAAPELWNADRVIGLAPPIHPGPDPVSLIRLTIGDVQFALNLQARTSEVAAELERALNAPGPDVAPAALAIARVEYPALETRGTSIASTRWASAPDSVSARRSRPRRIPSRRSTSISTTKRGSPATASSTTIRATAFSTKCWIGGRESRSPSRWSTSSSRAGPASGSPASTFPDTSFFVPPAASAGDDLIIDPFHGGALLSEFDCRQLLRSHLGDEAAFDRSLLAPATRHEIVVRMLVNLKRLYVRMRSFPQARFVSTLLLTADPSAVHELRDRGLLAYHLRGFRLRAARPRGVPAAPPGDTRWSSTSAKRGRKKKRPPTMTATKPRACWSRRRSGVASRGLTSKFDVLRAIATCYVPRADVLTCDVLTCACGG